MAVKVTIYKPVIANILFNNAKKQQGLFYGNAMRSFDSKKEKELLGKLLNHPVSLEMETSKTGGPASEKSAFLSRGNLYSFLGFYPNAELIDPIYGILYTDTKLLNQNVKISKIPNGVKYSFPIQTPSLKEIYDTSPAPSKWGKKSWIQYIEDGIPNFIFYIFSLAGFPEDSNSRSGHGLQRKGTSPVIKGIPYVKDLLEKFIKLFK